MHMIIKRLIKWLVRAISVFLPEAKAHDLQRWRRGKEEFWKYNRCQYIFASYGKSGRTWVRVMISRYYQLVYKLPDNILMGFDNYTRLNKDIPKIFFTHDNYLRGYTGNVDSKKDFYKKKDRVVGAQAAGCGGVAILPVEVPHAPGKEGNEQVSGPRSGYYRI